MVRQVGAGQPYQSNCSKSANFGELEAYSSSTRPENSQPLPVNESVILEIFKHNFTLSGIIWHI
jgi:hypothetical protein